MRFESWNHCNVHMHHCCPHLRFDHLGKRQNAKRFRVRNFQAVAAPKLSRTLTTTERAVAEAKASLPFGCPYGCGEGYETEEECDRHVNACARAIAHHYQRGNEARKLRQAQQAGSELFNSDGNSASTPAATATPCANANANTAHVGRNQRNKPSSPAQIGALDNLSIDGTSELTSHQDSSGEMNEESHSNSTIQNQYLPKRSDGKDEVRASMPFMCPAHGCGERYETRERCERHLKACARAIAHHRRKDEAKQLRPAFVGGGDTICNTVWGESNTTADTMSDEAFEFVPPSSNNHDGMPMSFTTGNDQNVSPADMANLSLGTVSKLAPHPYHSHGNTYAHSPYPQLPEHFGSYNCLRCSRGYTNWVDCVAHMVGCCNQVYENGKLWGGVEGVRIRCGVEEPCSKKCTRCESFKSKQDFDLTEWAEIGKADKIRQCIDCVGLSK